LRFRPQYRRPSGSTPGGLFFYATVERGTLRIINASEPPMFEPSPSPQRHSWERRLRERNMSINIRERAAGPGARLVGLLATIRWEAQFKLAKCCMRASKSISDLGVFLAEPVLERSKAMNDVTARLREDAPS